MDDDRLPTELWLMAHVRRCNGDGVPAMVLHRGDASRGTVVLKLNLLGNGFKVLIQSRGGDGTMGWMAALGGALATEAEADAYIARAVGRDPDLWVVEIEHREGWHPFDGREI